MEEIKYPGPKQNYRVMVSCMTFNQRDYIEETLNGFAIQKTNFPYVCLIVDDCSTDGEQDVITRFLNCHFDMASAERIEIQSSSVIIARHKTNVNCTFAVYLLKRNLWKEPKLKGLHIIPWRNRCEYIALCEGDDYWTDSLKLQKQADYLDTHPDCGLVYAKARRYSQKDRAFAGEWGRVQDYENLLFNFSDIPTLTALYRAKVAEDYYMSRKNDPLWPIGDVPLWLYFMYKSKVKFMDEYVGVYRMLEQSACRLPDPYRQTAFYDNSFKCRAFYARRYWGDEIGQDVERHRISTVLDKIIWTEVGGYRLKYGDIKNAGIHSCALWAEWVCTHGFVLKTAYKFAVLVARTMKHRLGLSNE